MADLKNPFNLYDIWANIFPGMFLIIILAMENFHISNFKFNYFSDEIITGSLFVFASYVSGQLIQGLGHAFRIFSHYFKGLLTWIYKKLHKSQLPAQRKLHKSRLLARIYKKFKKLSSAIMLEQYPSEQFLEKSSGWFSKKFRKKLDRMICSRFKVSHKIKPFEKFELCYMYVAQNGFGEKAERFSSLYGFYRGMAISSILSLAISIYNLYVLKINTITIGAMNIPIISVILILTISAIIFLMRSGRFDKKFAQEIYEQFYVASVAKK